VAPGGAPRREVEFELACRLGSQTLDDAPERQPFRELLVCLAEHENGGKVEEPIGVGPYLRADHPPDLEVPDPILTEFRVQLPDVPQGIEVLLQVRGGPEARPPTEVSLGQNQDPREAALGGPELARRVDLAEEAFVADHQHGRPLRHVVGGLSTEFAHLGLRRPPRQARQLAGEHDDVVPEGGPGLHPHSVLRHDRRGHAPLAFLTAFRGDSAMSGVTTACRAGRPPATARRRAGATARFGDHADR
jgi:hypothetical protein